MIHRTTLYLVALSCLGAGFVAGVVFSAIKNAPAPIAAPQLSPTKTPALDLDHDQQQVSEVISALQEQVRRNPQDYEAWVRLGNGYYDSNQPHDAIAAYLKALALNDESADVWTDLGVMYRRHGEPQQALNCFAKAHKRDGEHLSSLYNKGLVLLADLHDKEGAIAAWEQLVAINPMAATPSGEMVANLLDELKQRQ